MFQITIISSSPGSPAVALWYKEKNAAEIAHTNIVNAQKGAIPTQILKAEDDFGATVTIDKDTICYVVLIDGDKQAELQRFMPQQPRTPPRMAPEA